MDQKSKINVFPEGANLKKNKSLKTFQKQKHHLVDLSDLPEEMRLGQLFLQCGLSNPQAKQGPLLNWDLGRNAACRNWKGWSKGLDSVVSAEAWMRNMRKRSMIRFVISRTRFNPRFLSFRVKSLLCRFFSFRNMAFVFRSIPQIVSNVKPKPWPNHTRIDRPA